MPAPFQDQLAALHAEAERLTGAGDWAGTAGDWVEISYLAAAVADGFLTRRNQAG